MATKNTANELNFEQMDDEALLQQEKELAEKMAKIAEAKKHREESLKNTAFTEIEQAISKYFGSIVTQQNLTDFLKEKNLIVLPVAVATASKVGRRKINDEDLLFSFKYKNEDGSREMTLKLDADSENPAPASGTAKQLKKLQAYEFSELKKNFKPKFFEFAKKQSGKDWIAKFFPNIAKEVEEYLASQTEEAETV